MSQVQQQAYLYKLQGNISIWRSLFRAYNFQCPITNLGLSYQSSSSLSIRATLVSSTLCSTTDPLFLLLSDLCQAATLTTSRTPLMILGNAIGRAPKDKIFKKYIEIELQLGNIDRCRKLYEKYLEWSPENCYAWTKYAELERSLCETDRTRSIYELAIAQPALDMPELLWKAYIDFEISEGEFENTRGLYERLLDRTKHMKVWISYAKFEADAAEDSVASDMPEAEVQEILDEKKKLCVQRARRIFERAISHYRVAAPELKEERAMLLEEWRKMEVDFGELGDVASIQAKMPKKLKRRRPLVTEDGLPTAFEEYFDYLFPEETPTTNLKILEAAYNWKKQKRSGDDD